MAATRWCGVIRHRHSRAARATTAGRRADDRDRSACGSHSWRRLQRADDPRGPHGTVAQRRRFGEVVRDEGIELGLSSQLALDQVTAAATGVDVAEAHDAEDALADKDPFGVGISGVVGRERIEGIAPVAVPRGVGDRAGGAAGRVGRNLREAAGTSDARVELDLRDAGTDGGRDSERVSLSSSGTVAAPIDFTAVPGQNVTLTGGTNGFYTNGKSYVTIQGFTVSGTTQDAIVVSRNSSHITVRGNRVTNAGQPVSGLTARGVRVDITNDNTIANNTVDHNTDYGIYVVGGSTRNEITGNRVFSNARGFERAASGIRIHDSAGNTISGNFSHDNEDSGIELVTGSPNNFVINNVVYNNGDHGIDNTGNSPNNSVIGNAVYNSLTSGINFEGGATGSAAYNNIAVDNGINSPRTKGNIRVDSTSTTGTTLDYNVVDLSVPGRNYEWGIGYDTLLQMQVATGQERTGSKPTRSGRLPPPPTSSCSSGRRPSTRPTRPSRAPRAPTRRTTRASMIR